MKEPKEAIAVLVGNKSDLEYTVDRNKADDFAKEHGIRHFIVSAKEEGDKVKDMFNSLFP